MKRIAYILFSIVLMFVLTSGIDKSAGPPACHANEPAAFGNCSECHLGNVNQGAANVDMLLNGADTAYIPGHVYTFTLSVKRPGLQTAGFQFIVLQNNSLTVSPGTITLTDPNRTQKIDPSNPHTMGSCQILQKVWVEHTFNGIASNPQGESIWTIQWKAPENNVGGIGFYMAALETNNSGDELGDAVYTRSATSNAAVTGLEEQTALNTTQVFIDPVQQALKVNSSLRNISRIELKDMQGRSIREFRDIRGGHAELNVDAVSPGLYFVVLHSGNYSSVRKVYKSN